MAAARLCDHWPDRTARHQQHLRFDLVTNVRPSLSECVAPNIADAPVLAGIAPGPAETVVEHREMLARGELLDDLGILLRCDAKSGRPSYDAVDRIGIMGSDDPADQGDVGQVFAIGV